MNAAATLIAGFGLLQNSQAVIIGAMLIAMLIGPIFTMTFRHSIAQSVLESGIRKTVSPGMATIPGARVVSVTLLPHRGENVAWVVVHAPQAVSPQQVAGLNELVDRATGSSVDLHVRSVITAETTREGYVHEPDILPTEDPSVP